MTLAFFCPFFLFLKQDFLKALYDPADFKVFKVLKSIDSGYLLGDSALPKYCAHKIAQDVLILDLKVQQAREGG